MRFLEPGSRETMRAAGADVDEETQMVRLDRGLVEEKLALAPSTFTLRARNQKRDLVFGGNHIVFASVGGPAFVSDLDNGRRPGTYAELCDYFRVVQSLNILHQEGGGAFEPMDLPAETRHLDLYLAHEARGGLFETFAVPTKNDLGFEGKRVLDRPLPDRIQQLHELLERCDRPNLRSW